VPELPDITVYVEALERRLIGQRLLGVRIVGLNLLRTVEPEPAEAIGREVRELRRIGKRIVIGFEGELFFVLHLMIAGRLRWVEGDAAVPGKVGLAAFRFSSGTLVLTEAGTKKRASLHVVQGEAGLAEHDRGGIDPLAATAAEFAEALRRESHTVKRALTDPRLFSGIGNSYSDEILHRAKLSPMLLTGKISDAQVKTLRQATREILKEWIERLREETGEGFPTKVTAFRERMAVHGRYKQPCPVCGSPVQRIVYADNETNYCARCQTGGRLLADRALSRLLKADWPRTLEEMEAE
jgi:formamidopyrimidine-DNA glycosylase